MAMATLMRPTTWCGGRTQRPMVAIRADTTHGGNTSVSRAALAPVVETPPCPNRRAWS